MQNLVQTYTKIPDYYLILPQEWISSMNSKQRYDYIDTLKGGAIIFVVLYHSQFLSLFYTPNSVRPLLFMIISGMFFRESISWGEFFKRNIWGLIIPYIAYNLLCGIEYNALHACGINMPPKDLLATFSATLPHKLPNTPVWFLLTLFITSLIFRCVALVVRRMTSRYRLPIIAALSLVIGYVGYYIGSCHIHTPLFPEVALTSIVFYAMGYLFSQMPVIEYNKQYDRVGYALIIPVFAIYILLRDYVSLAENNFSVPYWRLLLMMASLYVAVFYICKLVGKLPLVTYMGRYSLIVLCTHLMVLPLFMGIALRLFNYDMAVVASSVATLLALRWPIIPFCKKYLPMISGEWLRRTTR